jgi:hypothetical protein
MLNWWIEWYYELPYFTNSETPSKSLPGYNFSKLKRPFNDASQKFRQRLQREKYSLGETIEVLSSDSDYVDQLE